MPEPIKLNTGFFSRDSADVAQNLLGCELVHGQLSGRIVETEAYYGENDPASHASNRQNHAMFGPPGRTYIYLCYGLHHMFNVVTEPEGTAGAVLIRALEPVNGIEDMQANRGVEDRKKLCNGPGKLCQALNIDKNHHNLDITHGHLHLRPGPTPPNIQKSGRIGITRGQDLQLRFYEDGNEYVSR